jgi:phage tail sheath protein FI
MARPRRPRDPIAGVASSVAAIVGSLPASDRDTPFLVTSLADFEFQAGSTDGEVGDAVRLFFENGGRRAYAVGLDDARPLRSLDALAYTDFNILVVPATARLPGSLSLAVRAALFAEKRRAFYVADPPAARTAQDVARWARSFGGGPNSAVYFPRLRVRSTSGEHEVAASGAVAGIYARTDIERSVWVSPSDAHVRGALGPAVELTDSANDALVEAGVNTIRFLPGRGLRLRSARTREENDEDWKSVPIRRLALFIEESLQQGLQWTVFEPNDHLLWRQARAAARAFLQRVWQQGGLKGSNPDQAFFVRCDRTTMTQDDIDHGRLIMEVGVAPLRPAEFVVLRIGQWARGREREECP